MTVLEGMYPDAPEALGEMFFSAVRERNASLMNNLLHRPFLWGKYYKQLTEEEQKWCTENTQQEESESDFD